MDMVLLTCLWGLSLFLSSLAVFYMCCYFLYLSYLTSSRTIDLLFFPNCFSDFDFTMPFDLDFDLDLE
jgi:hypothetical protein